MKTIASTPLTKAESPAESPRFVVTALEFEEAAAHETELVRLDRQRSEMRADTFTARIAVLRALYREKPTDENLRTLKEMTEKRDILYKNHDLYSEVYSVFVKFIEATLSPWATLIILRGLELERARFAKVVEQENQKHFSLCGHLMCQSIVIERARTPVSQLEDMLSSLKQSDPEPDWLRERLFRGLEKFRSEKPA